MEPRALPLLQAADLNSGCLSSNNETVLGLKAQARQLQKAISK
jgi:hypothetical protein